MSGIIVPRRKIWTRQPQRPARVDRDFLGFNPEIALLGSIRQELSSNKPVTWSSAMTQNVNSAGVGFNQNNVSSGATITGTRAITTGKCTFVAVLRRTASNAYNCVARLSTSGGYLLVNNGNGTGIGISVGGVGDGPNLTLQNNVVYVVVSSMDGSTYYVTAKPLAGGAVIRTSGSFANSASHNGTAVVLPSASPYAFAGEVYMIAAGFAFIPESKARSILDNPFRCFKPRTRRTIIDLGASSGALAAAASGADSSSGSATIAAQVALAGVGVSVAGGSAQSGVAVPLSAAGISVAGGSANGVATVSISAAGLAQAAGQAGLSASVLIAAAGAAQAAGNTALAALLNAQAAGAGQAGGSANLTGGAPGALSANGGDVASGSAVLSVSVQLQAIGAAQASGSANGAASAPGAISATGQANASGFATWSALVTLTAAGFVQAMGAGSFKVDIPLAAAGTAQASGVAQASLGGLVNRFALQAREKRLTEAAASVLRVSLLETDVARLTRLVHEVKHV